MMEKYALMKVMKEILGNPSKRYSVTEAAKKSGVSTFAAKKSLDWLFQKKMLSLEKVGRTYQYSADLGNFLTRQWKTVFSLEDIASARLVENILGVSSSVSSIVLYGSAAVGRDDENSDLDILVIADVSAKKKHEFYGFARGASREVNVAVYTPQEWRKKAAADKVFYEHVVMDCIALHGQKPVVL